MTKTALITGITGQIGSYLAELLLSKGYVVHGIIRRTSQFSSSRIDFLYQDPREEGCRLFLHYGDLSDGLGLREILTRVRPDEIYHLGAQSHVAVSFQQPIYTAHATGLATLNLLEAVRDTGLPTKIYNAASSEMFGSSPPPQSETTLLRPQSPYACAKVFGFNCCVNYREAYKMFVANGICFNCESPRRGPTFVTRKITRAATRIKLGLQDVLYLGNLDVYRDWGYAGDYVKAMWLMLQQDEPDDYVIATGKRWFVSEFLHAAFGSLDLDWGEYVKIDDMHKRPADVAALLGDSTKIREKLGWEPEVGFHELVKMMVDSDMKLAEQELRNVS